MTEHSFQILRNAVAANRKSDLGRAAAAALLDHLARMSPTTAEEIAKDTAMVSYGVYARTLGSSVQQMVLPVDERCEHLAGLIERRAEINARLRTALVDYLRLPARR